MRGWPTDRIKGRVHTGSNRLTPLHCSTRFSTHFCDGCRHTCGNRFIVAIYNIDLSSRCHLSCCLLFVLSLFSPYRLSTHVAFPRPPLFCASISDMRTHRKIDRASQKRFVGGWRKRNLSWIKQPWHQKRGAFSWLLLCWIFVGGKGKGVHMLC